MNKNKKTAIYVGLLFLLATFTFAIGNNLILLELNKNLIKYTTTLLIGVILEIICGISVVGIGILMYPLLKNFNQKLAKSYVILRILEFIVITISTIYIILTLKLIQNYDSLIYIFTATGGIIFSYLLYISNLVPKFFSTLGIAGYITLLIGVILTFTNTINFDTTIGMIFFIPGGLFELILPIWLFVKGFNIK